MGCCGKQYGNIIPVSGGSTNQKTVSVIAGAGISVNDLSDASQYKFVVSATDVDALTADLVLVAKEGGVTRTNPILKGTVIDALNLTWSYNKTVVSQSISNTAGLTPPSLNAVLRVFNYESQNIIADISLTLTGNDGLALSGSIATDTVSVQFGDVMYLGKGASKINTATSGIEAFIESLATSVVKTARSYQYYATGGVNEKHFVAYPKAWGLATFQKLNFQGGYVRLKNVAGTLKSTLDISDTETDFSFTNAKGYSEAYYVYESLIDNQADAVNPFTIL